MTARGSDNIVKEGSDMETMEPTNEGAVVGGTRRSGRLIARIGSAKILRGPDGFLDISSDSPGARNAALAWMFTVNPSMIVRVRPCTK